MQRTRSRNRRGQSAKGDGGIESNLHNESREMVLLLNFCTRARYTRRPDLLLRLLCWQNMQRNHITTAPTPWPVAPCA